MRDSLEPIPASIISRAVCLPRNAVALSRLFDLGMVLAGGGSAVNYFNLYPGDYRRDTSDLSLVEHGAYLLLLMAYYSSDGELPTDAIRLYRLCGAVTQQEMDAVDTVISRFFVTRCGKLRNKKADKEIAKAAPRIRAARENGRKGGKRASDPEAPPSGNPLGSPEASPLATQPTTHAGVGVGVGLGVKSAASVRALASGEGEGA